MNVLGFAVATSLAGVMFSLTSLDARADFTSAYAMQNWRSSGISGGTTSISPASGGASTATFAYDVNLGNPGGGVSFREAAFFATAADSGTTGFNWQYDFFHAWFDVSGRFTAFADGPSGRTSTNLVNLSACNSCGPQTFSGTASLALTSGYDFGFIVGGSNFDSDSRLIGTLAISNFSAPPPQANNDSYSMVRDQALAIDFLANDLNASQVQSVGSPSHGSLASNQSGYVYKPAPGFVGTDTFTYTISNGAGARSSATVSISVADGTLNNAGQNPQDQTLVEVLQDILVTGSGSPALMQKIEGIAALLNEPGGVQMVNQALTSLAPEETVAQGINGSRLSRIQVNNINQRLIELHSGAAGISLKGLSLNVNGQALPAGLLASVLPYEASGSGASADGDLFHRLGFFVNGQFEVGDRASNVLDLGYHAKTYGMSLGADYWLTPDFLLGLSGGYGYTDSTLSRSAGSLDIDGYTVSAFGSYHFTDRVFVDAIANGTYNVYKGVRNINYVDAFGPVNEKAKADTQGWQQRYSLITGYDYPYGAWTFGLRARGEYGDAGIDAYRERGADGLNLAIGEQNIVSLTSGLGGLVNYVFGTPFGVFTPQLNLEWEHEYEKDARSIYASFVEDSSGNRFAVLSGNPDRDHLNLRSSIAATLPNGGSAFLQYETVLSLRNETRHALNAGVRLEF